jgi:hypothetical protein
MTNTPKITHTIVSIILISFWMIYVHPLDSYERNHTGLRYENGK